MSIDESYGEMIYLHTLKDLIPKIMELSTKWQLTIQETIIKMLREALEEKKE